MQHAEFQGYGSPLFVPFAVAFEKLGGRHYQARGNFVLYVCRACGFTDLYTANPEEIPLGTGRGYNTELVDVRGPTPYR